MAVDLRGTMNHKTGVRNAGAVLAINHDPVAPVFEPADGGLVGDWRVLVRAVVAALGDRQDARVPVTR